LASSAGFREEGEASWYGKKFHGRKTANGETYDMHQLTAAHKTLPFHTWVKVVNLDNRREVKVRINDRGPFHAGRVIDLSHAGARALGMVESGTARVTVEALGAAEIREINGRPEPVLVKPKSYSHGQFVVQVGSFKVKSNAVRLSKMMKKRHGRARVTVYDRGDAVFYRVHVGDEKTIGDAMDLRAELERQGYRDSFVVAY
jgi:rare lipoprotein A